MIWHGEGREGRKDGVASPSDCSVAQGSPSRKRGALEQRSSLSRVSHWAGWLVPAAPGTGPCWDRLGAALEEQGHEVEGHESRSCNTRKCHVNYTLDQNVYLSHYMATESRDRSLFLVMIIRSDSIPVLDFLSSFLSWILWILYLWMQEDISFLPIQMWSWIWSHSLP